MERYKYSCLGVIHKRHQILYDGVGEWNCHKIILLDRAKRSTILKINGEKEFDFVYECPLQNEDFCKALSSNS